MGGGGIEEIDGMGDEDNESTERQQSRLQTQTDLEMTTINLLIPTFEGNEETSKETGE